MMPDDLDDESLYVFVFGPGFGESIAIRVPPDQWMVIDSCYVAGKAAALHVLQAYGGTCECLMLTHSHEDHYPGISGLIDHDTWRFIGFNEPTIDNEFYGSADPEVLLLGELEQAIASIRRRWSTDADSKWKTFKNTTRRVGTAELKILHPPEELIREHKGKPENRFSSAALLTWESVQLLLGADVPNPHWKTISGENPNLKLHRFLKMPHHGSDQALDDGFLLGDQSRLWVVTPYSRGSKRPTFRDGCGVQRMLKHVDAIYLTGLPVAHALQHEAPCHVTRQGIAAQQAPTPIAFTLPGGITGTVTSERDDVSCYVVARFAANGSGGILSCGPGSVRVTEDAAVANNSGTTT